MIVKITDRPTKRSAQIFLCKTELAHILFNHVGIQSVVHSITRSILFNPLAPGRRFIVSKMVDFVCTHSIVTIICVDNADRYMRTR